MKPASRSGESGLTRQVSVIGAGVIGVATALQLQRRGFGVTLVDRNEPAEGCSSGNAGILAAYAMVPLSLPGVLRKVPHMMLDPLGPLSIRPQYLFKIAPWLWRFWRASNPQRVAHIAAALSSLVHTTVAEYQDLTRGTAAAALIAPTPILCAYKDRNAYLNDRAVWHLRDLHGVRWHTLEGAEVQAMEPALAREYGFAAVIEQCGYTLNPQRLVKILFDEFVRHGGHFVRDDVRNLVTDPKGARQIMTASGHLCAQCVVIACGARSGQLSRLLGEPVPLEAERGYHLTLSGYEGHAPRYPIMSPSQKVIATPMEMGVRIAGMVEFGGFLPPDYRKADILRTHLSRLFPQIRSGTVSSWMGHRPSLPDSLPVIGPSARHEALYYAFGHQHIGLSTAPITGRIIADLVSGDTPPIEVSPFRVDRF